MNEHTPGPWKESGNWYLATSSDTTITFTAITDGERTIAAVLTDTREIENYDEIRANVKLIAAAPELLQALETIASAKRSDGAYDKHDMAGAIVIAQRAIDEIKEVPDEEGS